MGSEGAAVPEMETVELDKEGSLPCHCGADTEDSAGCALPGNARGSSADNEPNFGSLFVELPLTLAYLGDAWADA